MSLSRAAALLAGLALAAPSRASLILAVLALALVTYGLMPRRGARAGSKLARIACGVLGLALLALSLPPALLAAVENPGVLPAVLCFLLIPGLALTLRGFGVGVLPRLSARAAARARALASALITSVLGSAILVTYVPVVASEPGFLWELHDFEMPGPAGHAHVRVPGWLLLCVALSLGSLLAIPGFASLARLGCLAKVLERAPMPGWAPDLGGKAAQAFALAVAAALIGTGPLIYSKSGEPLAALLVSAFGALLMLVVVDAPVLTAAYRVAGRGAGAAPEPRAGRGDGRAPPVSSLRRG